MNIINILSFICVLLFLLLFIGRTIQMMVVNKINPFVIGAGKKGFRRFLEVLMMIGLALWIYQSLASTLELKIQVFPELLVKPLISLEALKYSGLGLMGIGLLLFLGALISFKTSWRVGIDKDNPGELITSGIFKISRNPIFLFMDIFFLGFALVYFNIFFLFYSAATIFGIHYQIIQEEKFLLEKYGEPYREYMKKVRRYL